MPRQLYSTTATTAREWWWLGGEQRPPVERGQWQRYAAKVEEKLSLRYDEMRSAGRDEGLVLDLDPLPYQVWRTRSIKVTNPVAPIELRGRRALCGLLEELWNLPNTQLPASVLLKHGTVVAGFFQFVQILTEHARWLERFNSFLTDPKGVVWPHPDIPFPHTPRPSVVLLIEDDKPALPGFMTGSNRLWSSDLNTSPSNAHHDSSTSCDEKIRSPHQPKATACDEAPSYEWWWLNGEQRSPVHPDQWVQYDLPTQTSLSSTYESFRNSDTHRTFLFNLQGVPYQIRQGKSVKVQNQNMPNLYGWRAVGGLKDNLWNLPPEQLPCSTLLRQGRIVSGFFQIHKDHVDLIEEFDRFLADPNSPNWGARQFPKRCVVLLIVGTGIPQTVDVDLGPVRSETVELEVPKVSKPAAFGHGNPSGVKLQSKQAWDAPQKEPTAVSCSVQ